MRRGVSTAVCRRVLRAPLFFRVTQVGVPDPPYLHLARSEFDCCRNPSYFKPVCVSYSLLPKQYCIQDGDCLLLGGREVPWVAGPRTLTVSDNCATHQHHTTRTLRRDFFPFLAGHEGLARARLLLTPPPPTLVARLRLPARVAAWGTGGAASASPCAFSKVL